MATTTTNYGFDVPTSSDLVKNGATAISTLGQDIDTFLFRPFTENAVINGAFDIWQRGTTFTNPANGSYVADRWCIYNNGNTTITQETSLKPDTSTYALKLAATGTSADNGTYQLIEQMNMEQFRGKTVIFSIKIAGTTGIPVGLAMAYSTTANDTLTNTSTAITPTILQSSAISTSGYVTFASSFAVPTTAKTLRIGINSGSMVNTNVLYLAEAQVEIGNQASPFTRAGGTIQGELAACQRYYTATTGAASGDTIFVSGFAFSSTVAMFVLPLGTSMRVGPSSMDLANQGVYRPANGVTYSSGTWSLNQRFNNCVRVIYTHGSAVFTAGESLFPSSSSSTTSIGFSAEL